MTSVSLGNRNNESHAGGPPLTQGRRSLTFDMGQLKQHHVAHGTFFFGPHSHEVDIASTYKPELNSIQKELLDDEIIDVEKEKERCARYNFKINNETHPKRRRLFLGALLGDDSMEVLEAVAMEVYDIFHTVSFIEGNTAHDLSPRKWKYYDPKHPSEKLSALYQMYGPKSKVSVDYYNTTVTRLFGDELFMDYVQREGNTFRWALNGMREDDVAIMRDADEIFTRDFLRAMQICDVAEFRPDQDCRAPKVIASTAVFESSPNCVTKDRRWHHPDALLGKCIEHTGNLSLHPPTKRQYAGKHGLRLHGYGADGEDYSNYVAEGLGPENTYPLWHGTDMRLGNGGNMYGGADGSPTGYHFHNFFMSADEVRYKYATYGHANSGAKYLPVWEVSPDVKMAVDCAHGVRDEALDFNGTGSSVLPIYYLNDEVRNKRHQLWLQIVKAEEEHWSNRTE
ncbi:hypothetical protein ACHAXA_000776 [Cyclostephanos tholiformis]|uniref:Uncharacterized protein n=1 Tax=Cyclostephanos tholiformis TaxID=382380 RepID=A0ABD3REB1_9STRA